MKQKISTTLMRNWHYIQSNGDPVSQAVEQGKDDAFIKAALSHTKGQITLK